VTLPLLAVLNSALEKLFNAQYFDRTWTIQELAFSSKAVVRWAKRALPWFIFWAAGQAYLQNASHDFLTKTHGFYIHGMAYGLLHWKWLNSSPYGGISQAEFLAMTGPQSATDPRDKIFGLQQILELLGPVRLPKPDYSKSVEDVYIATAKALVTQTHFNLWGVLRHAPSPNRSRDLPSWVPDWRYDTSKVWPIAGLCGRTHFPLTMGVISSVDNRLRVLGKFFGVVEKTSSDHPRQEKAAAWAEVVQFALKNSGKTDLLVSEIIHKELVARYRELGNVNSNVYQLIKFSSHYDYETWYDRIKRLMFTLYRAIGFEEVNWDRVVPKHYNSNLKPWRILGASLACACSILELGQDRSSFHEKSLFALGNGFLGLTFGDAVVGDVIALLPGLDAPAILRPSQDLFRLIGFAYIFGAMNADIWKMEGLELTEIVII
jgi:hypothetical protein